MYFQMVIVEMHSGVTAVWTAQVTSAFTDMHCKVFTLLWIALISRMCMLLLGPRQLALDASFTSLLWPCREGLNPSRVGSCS